MKATFGWEDNLVVSDRSVPLRGYPRYESPFIKSARGAQVYRIECGGERHQIDLAGPRLRPFRQMS